MVSVFVSFNLDETSGSEIKHSVHVKSTFTRDFFKDFIFLKGTISVIYRDSPCKDGNARLTAIPFKPLTVDRENRDENSVCISLK